MRIGMFFHEHYSGVYLFIKTAGHPLLQSPFRDHIFREVRTVQAVAGRHGFADRDAPRLRAHARSAEAVRTSAC
jgi:hypothetical protein